MGCQSEEGNTRRHLDGEVNQAAGQTVHGQHLAEEANASKEVMQKLVVLAEVYFMLTLFSLDSLLDWPLSSSPGTIDLFILMF